MPCAVGTADIIQRAVGHALRVGVVVFVVGQQFLHRAAGDVQKTNGGGAVLSAGGGIVHLLHHLAVALGRGVWLCLRLGADGKTGRAEVDLIGMGGRPNGVAVPCVTLGVDLHGRLA